MTWDDSTTTCVLVASISAARTRDGALISTPVPVVTARHAAPCTAATVCAMMAERASATTAASTRAPAKKVAGAPHFGLQSHRHEHGRLEDDGGDGEEQRHECYGLKRQPHLERVFPGGWHTYWNSTSVTTRESSPSAAGSRGLASLDAPFPAGPVTGGPTRRASGSITGQHRGGFRRGVSRRLRCRGTGCSPPTPRQHSRAKNKERTARGNTRTWPRRRGHSAGRAPPR